MSRGEQKASSQPTLRLKTLLVLTVLAGLLAMHGLGSAGPALSESAPTHSAHQTVAAASELHCACPDDNSADRHTTHADQMCASGAVPGTAAIPAPARVPTGLDTTAQPPAPMPYEPADGRAPPTLAQLQLLRI